MLGSRFILTLFALSAITTAAAFLGLWAPAQHVGALPPAGTDTLNVSAEVTIVSRLGQETIQFEGLVTIQRDEPRMDGGVEVVDAQIVSLDLEGESVTGAVTVSQSETLASTGEIRSLQALPTQFPASSFFDVFVDVRQPVSGPSNRSPAVVSNEDPLHLVPTSSLSAWPPVGAKYDAEPEAPAGSHCAQTPGSTPPPGGHPPPGGLPLLPALPAELCVTSVSITMGEVKIPTPTFTPCPAEVCTPTLSPTPMGTLPATLTPAPTFTPAPTPTRTATPGPTCLPAARSGNVFSDALAAPLPIPDRLEVADCIVISTSTTIDDLEVAIDISHTWVGDLVITLNHEDTGTTVTLVDRPGTSVGTLGCSEDDIDALLDDEASVPVEDECAGDAPAISGRFKPNQPLSAFDGESITGSWIIIISDEASGDVGTLHGWSLIVNQPAILVGDINCDSNVNSIDAALVLQRSAGLLSSAPCDHAGDANLDGVINSIDAALILQFSAGLIDQLPP